MTDARGRHLLAFAAAGVVVLVLVGATLAFRIGTSAATRSPGPSQIAVASATAAVASAATNAPTSSPTPSPAITAAPSPPPLANTYPLVNSCDPSSVPWATPVATPAVGKVGTFVLQVPVLMYHRIVPAAEAGNSIPGLVVAPEIFSAQLDALQKGGWHTMTMARLATDLQAHIKPPPKTFVITIDDGWDDGYTYALPVLAKHGFVATYFVITGRIDVPDFLSSAHLRTLTGAGDEIGDHTMDHEDLAGETADKLKYEIDAAAARIAQVTGVWPESLAYPSGGVDTAAAAAVAACGELRTAVIEAPPASTAATSPTPVPSATSGLTPAPSPTPKPTAAPSASAPPAAALPAAVLMAATTTMPVVYETWATRWTIPRLRVTPSTVPANLLAELNHYS